MALEEEKLEKKEGLLGPECDKPSATLNELFELETKHPPLAGRPRTCSTCGGELHKCDNPLMLGAYLCIKCALPD